MQKAKTILSILNEKSVRNKQFVFDKLYRNMFTQEFFIEAYQKMYAKPGNMTAGTDGQTIDGFKKSKVDKLIELLRNTTRRKNARWEYCLLRTNWYRKLSGKC